MSQETRNVYSLLSSVAQGIVLEELKAWQERLKDVPEIAPVPDGPTGWQWLEQEVAELTEVKTMQDAHRARIAVRIREEMEDMADAHDERTRR